MPCLQSQAEYQAEQIYLLSSKEKLANAKGLKDYLSKKARVEIVDSFGPDKPELLADYLAKLVSHHKSKLWLNLNGGTSLMCVATFLAKGDTPVHYIMHDKLQLFNEQEFEKSLELDMEIVDFLAVHGYKLTASKTYPLDKKLYKIALACLKENQSKGGSIKKTKTWPDFAKAFAKINGNKQVIEGDPNEYATYFELSKTAPKNSKVVAESQIKIPEDELANPNKKVKLSPDALVLHNASLLTVEVKDNIKKIFETNSGSNQLFMSQALGGHFAKSLIVCGRFGNYNDGRNDNRLEHLLNDDLTKKQLTIAIRERVEDWPQLEVFPPEDEDNPRKLFESWG